MGQYETVAFAEEQIHKDYKKIIADNLNCGELVALYCYGLFASHLICYLEKFYGVLPTIVIDNDPIKRGTAEFGIPVRTFAEARELFPNLQYFICSDDFKYAIIGDMLEKGILPKAIINYVPVSKEKICLPLREQLLIDLYPIESGVHGIRPCCEGGFENPAQYARACIQIPAEIIVRGGGDRN